MIGFLLLSVIALGHSQDSQCLQREATQQAQAIVNACGGLDNFLDHVADVSNLS